MAKKRCRAKKKSRAVDKVAPCESNKKKDDEQKIIDGLMSAFGSVTIEEAVAAYKLAEGDENKAAEILMDSLVSVEDEDQSTTISCSSTGNFASTSSSGNGSSLESELFAPADFVGSGVVVGCSKRKGRSKKAVGAAVAGTVSTMLGKDYVRSTPKKSSSSHKSHGGINSDESWRMETEQFLYSMLGVECELSMDVVRDVLCQCAYDVDKALNVLLDLSSSSEDPVTGHDNIGDGVSFFGMSNSTPDPRDSSDNTMAAGTEASTRAQQLDTEICQKVLESLFKMPNNNNNSPRSSGTEHDPSTMNWKNIVKKLSSLHTRSEIKQGGDVAPTVTARGDEYRVLRQNSKQHWESMKFCYQKAGNAFSNGNRSYASYLSEQGRQHSKMAVEADEKASHDIFHVRNKNIENLITIDLHGQHVKQAMRLLKLHLLFGAYVRSVRSFRVITGCGSHGLGKSKLKQSVTHLLTTEGVQWREENSGTLFVTLDGQTEFHFMDTDSDID